MSGNYGSDAAFSNNQMVDFRNFAQSQGYGTSIAPEECDLYDRVLINPAAAVNSPEVITFYDQASTDIFTTVQDPVIRNGAQIPTQNLLGIYGIGLELEVFDRSIPGELIDQLAQSYANSVFELYLAGDRQFMAKGSQLINYVGGTGAGAAPVVAGQVTNQTMHVLPSTKLVMPGSTIRAILQVEGTNPVWQNSPEHQIVLHIWAFNARR
jgi:hypothetical protein